MELNGRSVPNDPGSSWQSPRPPALGADEETASAGHPGEVYSYPRDLAQFERIRWNSDLGGFDLLPDAVTLEDFFSVCFHASMLREEERPVTFRAILAPPELFAPEGRPPEGLQRLDFSRSYPFHPSEVRRLSVTVDPQRTLIGGARHRSAYRLAGALPGSVVVVISQDGGVRFVCQKNGRVTYWEQQ